MTGTSADCADGGGAAGPEGPAPPSAAARSARRVVRVGAEAFEVSQLLVELSGLVHAREVLTREIEVLEERCWGLGVNRFLLAGALDLSRSKLYRRHPRRTQEQSRAVGGHE
jgi:hypothetical protein